MLLKGKQLSAETEELVVRLKKHNDKEQKVGKFVPTKNSAGRTAAGLGIGVASVKRIMARYARSGNKVVAQSTQRPGRPPVSTSQNVQPIVRQYIRDRNLEGARVSINRVREYLLSEHSVEIPKMTLWRALNRWGFTYGTGRRRDCLKEQDRVILARREYLRVKRTNRDADGNLKRPEVFLDETYINKNHSKNTTWYEDEDGPWVNKPSGVGPRLIIVHAITKDGLIDGAELVFEAKKRTGDYHGQMNWENFSKWFRTQLLAHIPKNSIVILDNARYHNVLVEDFFPNQSTTKEQLRCWLTQNNYPWRDDMLKSELLGLCIRLAPVPEFRLDKLALEHDISILRTPPYHPELQPIENCWGVVKNYMADHCDFTMAGLYNRLPDAFSKITSKTCRKIIAKVVEQENKYWHEDELLDEQYTANDEEEFKGRRLFEEEGLEHYIEEN